jgi:ABC-2 type transport system ATP-binding protein
MSAPAVLVDDLVVRFGELAAVGGVSFAVAPGEVFGLLGPNGAGKTTTIRVHMLDRLARTLSGGMLRRLEIASALLNRPQVLFLDEPTVGLDPNARGMVWERLAALRELAGTTILVTTHLMEEAERHCDRLGVIDEGRLIEQGEPRELIERHGAESLEEVFTTITGRPIDGQAGVEGGRFSDVRAQRRVARRLG